MKKLKIIVLSLLMTFLLVVVAVFLVDKNKQTKNNNSSSSTQASLQCAREGERIGASGMPNSCCFGLKAVGGWPGGYNGDCTLPPPPSGLNICTKCGDSKCDISNGENKCNCKEDCE